jgi:hypothetical protein
LRRKWPWVMAVLLLFVTTLYLLYAVVDQGVTIDHHAQEIRRQGRQIEALEKMTVALAREPLSREIAQDLLQRAGAAEIIKVSPEGELEADGISLHFEANRLIEAEAW